MKHKHENDDELESLLASNMEDFKKEFSNNVDDFHEQVLSAKPNPAEQKRDPGGYATRLMYYQELLQTANGIMKKMQQSVTDILKCYHQYLTRLWEAIIAGHDVRPLEQQFERQLRQDLDHHWGQVFKEAEGLIREIDANFRNPSNQSNRKNHHQ